MDNGLICPEAYSNPVTSYYADADTAIVAPTLVSVVKVDSVDRQGEATLRVSGLQAGVPYEYTGALNLSPGASSLGPASDGLTLRSVAGGVNVEVGTNSQTVTTLSIAGASGLSQVYDETYNQPVALQAITMVSQTPLCVRDPANTSEIFRCAQAAVAAADAGAGQTNRFTVPKSGFYALQMELSLFNAPAPAAVDINVPAIVAGGIDVYGSLGFTVSNGVVVIPYGSHESVGGELFSSDCLVQGSGVNKIHTAMYLLAAGTTYSFTMAAARPAGSTAWNIGTNGTIKAELIAMC